MKKILGVCCVLALAVFCGFQIYHQTGMVHATQKNGYGCICHNFDPTPGVRVWITGPDSLRAGAVGNYSINVARTGSIGAGFNVASYFGDLIVSDSAGTQLLRESTEDSLELTHTFTRLSGGRDTISWSFRFRAPANHGIIDTLYAAGNVVNNDTLPDGDFWNFAPKFLVRVVRPNSVENTPVARDFHLEQNFPNPFNPSTTIRFILSRPADVSLAVFDIAGKQVATLVNGPFDSGSHSVVFDAEKFASGIYVYRLSALGEHAARKMILTK